ncbi:MAG: energy-coupling factor transporter transmembrane protein EcfT [Candidatus Tokpelaia sp.]|uniref:CbiQ family ECF transporter T component n=1 Tax=Candidatus Tokpelaia sp. TaxID=2233777 RepID=UPI00123A9CE4|nr:CbiQ family ECF transporter T component [Candidatus Tokpelaia sp.]KAA6205377.1 MAG: energy-coupling factor transporter transmembrane protein EcfT [Candidatus Tokpelaia sp.]KAA6206810.1 MAG: energy-coupling factor transporter transmembrane protein EcfT [Candidatus Tokpelaia sp.]KAA6406203.1 energy-coupling factor transporter transmembrane protein EcfT [Candidatus Tokpelaia sp.]
MLCRPPAFFFNLAPSIKLAALFALSFILFFIDNIVILAGLAAAPIIIYRLAGFSVGSLGRCLFPAAILALLLFLFQFFATDFAAAGRAALRLFALLGFAAAVTATTANSALLAALERALRVLAPFGLKPRQTALALALTLRFMPLTRQIWHDIRAAQQARGGAQSLARLGLLISLWLSRLVTMQEDIAQAIEARGFDDEEREDS